MADNKSTAKKKPNAFLGFWKKIFGYLRSCVGEIKKITWTSPKTTTKNFLIVLAVIIVVGLFIYALDMGLYALLGQIMSTANNTVTPVVDATQAVTEAVTEIASTVA